MDYSFIVFDIFIFVIYIGINGVVIVGFIVLEVILLFVLKNNGSFISFGFIMCLNIDILFMDFMLGLFVFGFIMG